MPSAAGGKWQGRPSAQPPLSPQAPGFISGKRRELRGDLGGALPAAPRQDLRHPHHAMPTHSLASAASLPQPVDLPHPSSFFPIRLTSVRAPEFCNFVHLNHSTWGCFAGTPRHALCSRSVGRTVWHVSRPPFKMIGFPKRDDSQMLCLQ